MKMPKGFLFDFDGVVVNSFESHHSAWASAFKELFHKEIPPFPKEMAGNERKRTEMKRKHYMDVSRKG